MITAVFLKSTGQTGDKMTGINSMKKKPNDRQKYRAGTDGVSPIVKMGAERLTFNFRLFIGWVGFLFAGLLVY